MIRSSTLYTYLTVVILLVSCNQIDPSAVRNAAMTRSDFEAMVAPVRIPDRWQWSHISFDEFLNTAAATYNSQLNLFTAGSATDYLPKDHELTNRSQFWLDTIDNALRERFPEALKNVPRPQAIIKKSKYDPNANVNYASTCFDLPVHYMPAKAKGPKVLLDDLTVYQPSMQTPLALSLRDQTSFPCLVRPITDGALTSFLSWYNGQAGKCKLTLVGTARIEISPKCTVFQYSSNDANQVVGEIEARRFVIPQNVTDKVTVLTAIFPWLKSETYFVRILAHELGHYYRNQLWAPVGSYDFFYKLQAEPIAKTPIADNTVRGAGERLLSFQRDNRSWKTVAAVPGQQIHSRLFLTSTLVSYRGVQIFCSGNANGCTHPCGVYFNEISQAKNSVLKDFPGRDLTSNAKLQYLELEKRYISCAQTINIIAPSTGPAGVSLAEAQQLLSVTFLPSDALNIKTMQDAIMSASRVNMELDTKILREYNEVLEQHVAQYTAEQEADALSVQFLSILGIDPRTAVASPIDGPGNISLSYLGINEPSNDECFKLWKNNWKDETTLSPVFPFAVSTDSHHSNCFRTFSMDQVIRGYGLHTISYSVPPTAPGPSWKSIQDLANSINANLKN